jgi:UDP-3-O-[3-hydroxymyristoyl] glucosamine N-acyltransferase
MRADDDVFIDDRKLADRRLGPDLRAWMNARRGRHHSGRINRHKFVSYRGGGRSRLRVTEIAAQLEALWEGDGSLEISGVAPLESAGPREIAFVGNRKAASGARQSDAGCLLVTADFPKGRTLIRAANPRAACARVIELLHPAPVVESGVHPTAVIAESAEIAQSASIGPHATIGAGTRVGERSRIGPGCVIGSDVRIGANCVLHANVSVYAGVTVGDRGVLHSGVVLGADGFGFVRQNSHYEKFPQIGRVVVGNDVEIGANSCVDRAALGTTLIGDGTKLDNMVHIAHNCRIGRHVVIAAQTGLSGGVTVEDYAVIGGQVGIGDKARIESGAVLGSGCGILTSKIVRKGQVVWGTPARPLKQYLEQLANLARLPELRKQLAELEKQLRAMKRS